VWSLDVRCYPAIRMRFEARCTPGCSFKLKHLQLYRRDPATGPLTREVTPDSNVTRRRATLRSGLAPTYVPRT